MKNYLKFWWSCFSFRAQWARGRPNLAPFGRGNVRNEVKAVP